MNAPGQKDKFTPELRILAASLLSFGVIILWAKYFGPKPPVQPSQANRPAVTAPSTPGPATSSTASQPQAAAAPAKIAPASNIAVKGDSQERIIVVENTLYRVEISNRGGVVKSWQLKKYKDDSKPQRVLDVVHPDASQQTGGWPFSLSLSDPNLDQTANSGLYQATSTGSEAPGTLNAPAELAFAWSDGHLEV